MLSFICALIGAFIGKEIDENLKKEKNSLTVGTEPAISNINTNSIPVAPEEIKPDEKGEQEQ